MPPPQSPVTEPIKLACRALSRRWAIAVLHALLNQPLRFSEIQKRLATISTKSLGRVLLNLECEGLVRRTVKETRPPRVTYSLNDDPLLRQIIEMVSRWGQERLQKTAANPKTQPPQGNPSESRQRENSISRPPEAPPTRPRGRR